MARWGLGAAAWADPAAHNVIHFGIRLSVEAALSGVGTITMCADVTGLPCAQRPSCPHCGLRGWLERTAHPTVACMEEVTALLARQGGIARQRDVRRAGMSRRCLRRALKEGRLRALTPHLVTNVAEPAADEQLRAAAIGLAATISHEDAALMWGIELATTPDRRHVTVGRNRSRRSHPGTRVHRADVDPDDRVERDGVWVTGILRTLLDLCRSRPIAEAVVVLDSALRLGRVSVEELTGALRDLPAGRGRDRVARALLLIDPRSGSVLETLCRVLLHQAGLCPDESQLVVRDSKGQWIGRVDFAWPTARLIVEADGFAFHADRKSFRADRRRGNALVLEGWKVLHFSWEDVLDHPDEVVAAVRTALGLP